MPRNLIATGTVVMDITYDEPNPANDHFEIRVYDLAWKLLRSETFHREEVAAAEREAGEDEPIPLRRRDAILLATQKWVQVPETAPAPRR